ncbi:MAG: site-specific integrase [Acidimicrobiia bacterium]
MDIKTALNQWIETKESAGKRPQTLETYTLAVTQFRRFLVEDGRPTEVTKHDIRAFIAHFNQTRSPATSRQRFGSLRAFFNWMEQEGDFGLDINPIRKVEAPRVEEKVPEIIEKTTFKALLTTCGDDFAGLPDLFPPHLSMAS